MADWGYDSKNNFRHLEELNIIPANIILDEELRILTQSK